MSCPTFFDVSYAINIHMVDRDGRLKSVDQKKALSQWEALRDKFVELGLNVHLIPPVKGQPDMVFTANQTLPFLKDHKTHFILSRMHHDQRQKEVAHFKVWLSQRGFDCVELSKSPSDSESQPTGPLSFEGMGDALWNYESGELYGGFGFRTKEKVYDEIKAHVKAPVEKLRLINENFYHLDTCLAIVNKTTAFYVPSGFDKDSQNRLKKKFKHLIEVPQEEALGGFAANLCALNGRDIILQKNNPITCEAAALKGLCVHPLDTSEFIKSGGSVFCMKQLFW